MYYSPTQTIDLAKISQYLWANQVDIDQSLNDGSINKNRDIILYMERKALEYGYNQSLPNLLTVNNYVYALCGAKIQEAIQIYTNSSGGGIIVNPSTGASSLISYQNDFVVGDPSAPILDGQTSYNINIGTGRIWSAASVSISLDQAVLPQGQTNYISYVATYDTNTGLVNITFNAAVLNGQLYIVMFNYLVI